MSLLSIGGWLSEKGGLSRVTEDSLYTMLREKIGLGWKYLFNDISFGNIKIIFSWKTMPPWFVIFTFIGMFFPLFSIFAFLCVHG